MGNEESFSAKDFELAEAVSPDIRRAKTRTFEEDAAPGEHHLFHMRKGMLYGKGTPTERVDNGNKPMKYVQSRVLLVTALFLMLAIDVHGTPRGPYFWSNFAAWWMPQVFALCVALLFKPRMELMTGVALAYGAFALFAQPWEAFPFGWSGYLICLVGACVGVVVAGVRAMNRVVPSRGTVTVDGLCFVGLGVAANAVILRMLMK